MGGRSCLVAAGPRADAVINGGVELHVMTLASDSARQNGCFPASAPRSSRRNVLGHPARGASTDTGAPELSARGARCSRCHSRSTFPWCAFGIAFPAMVRFVEWRYLTTGDELYRTSARRWSKVMLALFASGDHGKRSLTSRWSTVAGVHRDVRLGLLARSCDRRVLVLRRRDFDRHVRVRVGAPGLVASSPQRDSGGERGGDIGVGQRRTNGY